VRRAITTPTAHSGAAKGDTATRSRDRPLESSKFDAIRTDRSPTDRPAVVLGVDAVTRVVGYDTPVERATTPNRCLEE
jgi:hypothetical protein